MVHSDNIDERATLLDTIYRGTREISGTLETYHRIDVSDGTRAPVLQPLREHTISQQTVRVLLITHGDTEANDLHIIQVSVVQVY